MDATSPRGGIVRAARRPDGWVAPGPRPVPPLDPTELWPGPEEDLCWIAGDWRILQRTDGHRFSLDDLATAHLAARTMAADGRTPARTLDLGCGIGSVLLFVAWRFPEARCLGIEAQPLSFGMARRSLAWNGIEGRTTVRNGDFRDPAMLGGEPPFDLITGTPPYFPRGTGLESDHVQRGPCRFEYRGGIEDYCAVAARHLAPGAPFVACAPSPQGARVQEAARAAGLAVERWQEIVPRVGKAPLISIFVLRRAGEVGPRVDEPPLVVRGADGQRTEAFVRVRLEMGMPP